MTILWYKGHRSTLISFRGVNDGFEITKEFLAMESLKGTTRREDSYGSESAAVMETKLAWSALASATAKGIDNSEEKTSGCSKETRTG